MTPAMGKGELDRGLDAGAVALRTNQELA